MRDLGIFLGDPNFAAIAVEGGPCAGKSTFLAVAKQWLEDHGMRVSVLDEVATELMEAGFSPTDDWRNSSFSEHAFLYMIERENRYYRILHSLNTRVKRVLLCDRTPPGLPVYMGDDKYREMLERRHIRPIDVLSRYKMVLHLVTAADGAEEHYTLANNKTRTETPERARELDKLGLEVWAGHPHLSIVDNSTDFDGKIRRALSSLARVLNMPEPTEIERKFLVERFSTKMIPGNAVVVEIEQDYLYSYGEHGEVERRVRKRTLNGASSFYYTVKKKTDHNAVRRERERLISPSKYRQLLKQKDPALSKVEKMRFCFAYKGHLLELDIYPSGLAILEVELRDKDEHIEFPEGWVLKEVTNDERYKNRSIAAGSLDKATTA
jgi:CYTH domain-containing protein/thymidylate kinase